ncbi:MAG: M1 family metallopeptidase, partial [bacterium]|nr:M1 family metallopeptidase [bacterium]
SFGKKEKVSNVKLNIFFNPKTNYVSGTTAISYESPSSLRVLRLAPGIDLKGNLDLDARGLNVFKKRGSYYLMGTETDSLSLYYNGYIKPTVENFELFKGEGEKLDGKRKREENVEAFYFLSRTQNFYPNPGDDFFGAEVTITIPDRLNCLATGSLIKKDVNDSSVSKVFKFKSRATKGISFVTGGFKLDRKLEDDGPIPLHIYTLAPFTVPKSLDLKEIKEAVKRFSQTFGSLDLPVVNILLKHGLKEGGVSNNGFIVVSLPYGKSRVDTSIYLGGTSAVEKRVQSPILIRNQPEDYILHELAHQWWGGVISWKAAQDVWLT